MGKKKEVIAVAKTADGVMEFEFDMAPWLEEADWPDVVEVREAGWHDHGNLCLDGRHSDPRFESLSEHCRINCVGYSVEFDYSEAEAWFKRTLRKRGVGALRDATFCSPDILIKDLH